MTFKDLAVGEFFEFSKKTPIAGGSYNSTGIKTSETTYRMGAILATIGNPHIRVRKIKIVPA